MREFLMTTRHAVLAFVLGGAALVTAPTAAQDLGQPTGEILLTVSGDLAVTNDGDAAVFDRAMLEAFEPVTFTTTTIWTEGQQTFTGVSLHDLLELLGIEAGVLSATAINDYAVEIPVEDGVVGGPIIAYLRNAAPMSVRDKGPLWIVYPYDDNPDYNSETIYSRSIWQLDRIIVDQ